MGVGGSMRSWPCRPETVGGTPVRPLTNGTSVVCCDESAAHARGGWKVRMREQGSRIAIANALD
jgi:hypothetical protein